jgi:hypothetical protein
VPIAYIYDDHDYGGNDSDGNAPSKPAALSAYKSFVPHYSLASPNGEAIYQAFTIGRVRILLTDSRSESYPSQVFHWFSSFVISRKILSTLQF